MATILGSNVLNSVPPSGPIRIWDAGVQWADIEKERGNFDWSKLDQLVNSAGKRSIMIVLGHPPAWAAKGGPDGLQASWMPAGSNRPPATMAAWKNYVNKIVTRYKDRVRYFQIWNEPADKRFYSGSWSDLATLTKTAYQEIKRIDKNLYVVSPPLQPRKQASWNIKGRAIFAAMKSVGYPFDIWSCHIYPQKGEGVEGFVRDCKLVKERISVAKKPLWITEMNYNLGGVGNPYASSDQIKLKLATQTACQMLDIPRGYWYAYAYNDPSLIAITTF